MIQSSFLILFFTGITYILNYVYTLVAIHFLTPFEYSELAFLIAVYSLFGVFGATISNVSLPLLHTQENTKIKNQVVATTKFLLIFLVILSFTIIPFFVAKFFNIYEYKNIILFSLAGSLSVAFSLLTTHLQVVKNFKKVGLIQVFSTLIKFLGSLLFLYFGFKIFGVGIALFLSSLLSIIFFFPKNQENTNLLKNFSPTSLLILTQSFWKEHKNFIIKSFVGSLILTLFVTLDTILAKKFLDENIVGYFIGISTLAKLFLYGVIAISTVIFPYMLAENSKEKQTKILKYFLSFIFVSGLIFIFVSYFFHSLFVPLILGNKYSVASNYLFPISLYVVSSTFAYILTQISILRNNKNFLKVTFAYFIFIVILSIFYILNIFDFTFAFSNVETFTNSLTFLFAIFAILLYNI